MSEGTTPERGAGEGPRSEQGERILVALDASPQSVAALRAAAELAALMEAELEGLFIEDINLLHLCGLPFSHEIGSYTAKRRQLDNLALERQLRGLATERRDADRVLEQAPCVPVMAVRAGSREQAHTLPDLSVVEHAADERREPRVGQLRGQELEKPVQLVGVPAHRGSKLGGVGLGRLDRADLQLQPPVEALDTCEHAHGVAFCEATVEQLDVVPDAALDPPARVDELERDVRLAAPRREASLAGDREDAVDGAVLDEVGDGCHGVSLGACRLDRWPTSARSAPCATRGRARR